MRKSHRAKLPPDHAHLFKQTQPNVGQILRSCDSQSHVLSLSV